MSASAASHANRIPSAPSKASGLRIFAYSRLDTLLVIVAGVQFALLEYGAWTCGSMHWSITLGLAAVCIFLMLTNFECVAHNFIHTPFFRSERLNLAFGVFNSLALGHPQTAYRVQHLRHHKYNNDLPDPQTGMTLDSSSTWRFGRPPTREESIATYALLAFFRVDYAQVWRDVRRMRLTTNLVCEVAAMLAALVLLGIGNWRGLVWFYLPVWTVGTVAAMAQNYLEHYGATPGNRKTDSVSCYNPLYNFIWLNHGYHQEHHYRPQVHWTRIAEIRQLLPPESRRRVARGAHWFNFAPVRRTIDE
jgi:fatty acid desaturase